MTPSRQSPTTWRRELIPFKKPLLIVGLKFHEYGIILNNICSIAAQNHCKQEQIIIQHHINTLLLHIKATMFQYNTCHMDPNVQYHNINIEFYVIQSSPA